MGKPLQLDDEGRIMGDTETEKTQKAYDAYQADLMKKQKELDSADAKAKERGRALLKFGTDLLSRPVEKKAKGGMVSSASKRADGCAIKGKTKGRIV